MKPVLISCFVMLVIISGCNKKTISMNHKENLTKYGIQENPNYELGGLNEGTIAPPINAISHFGNTFNLKNELANGPVVVIFYRGYWCPVCHRHLSKFEEDLNLLKEKNVTVVAITPEKMENIEKTVKKDKLTIPVIYDEDESIMKNYKVGFEVTDGYVKKIKTLLRSDIAEFNDQEDAALPIPATFVIGQDGKIIKSFYDPNYKNRASVQDILASFPLD